MSDHLDGPGKEYSDDEIMSPAFRLEKSIEGQNECRHLYMQIFERPEYKSKIWHSLSPDEWPLLASIFFDRIVMYPVYTNPCTQRYLKPKHGRFKTLVYQDDANDPLPETEEEARYEIDRRQAWRLFRDDCRYGLGLDEKLDPLWRSLSSLPKVDTIVVRKKGAAQISDNAVFVSERELNEFRLSFGRITRKGRELIKSSKSAIMRNDLLANLDPEKFPRIVRNDRDDVLLRVHANRRANTSDRAERKRSVKVVLEELGKLESEAPRDLMMLHAEIERVTLSKMIEKYESMLTKTALNETHWQNFFEQNVFILTMIFARPVRLLLTQFHAKGSSLDGTGAQIGDFLFAEHGQALALVEIKKPTSQLMLSSSYRNSEVYGPAAELSGAVTQVLYQQSVMQSHWLVHQTRPELKDSRPDAIRCVVISGTAPKEEAQRRSFEVFRNAYKNVEVVTFDELLAKLKLLLELLTPVKDDPEKIPF